MKKRSGLRWKRAEGIPGVQAPLSFAGHYTISHRAGEHNVSYRPPGEHHHVGTYKSAAIARAAASFHHRLLKTHTAAKLSRDYHIARVGSRFEKHSGWIATCAECEARR